MRRNHAIIAGVLSVVGAPSALVLAIRLEGMGVPPDLCDTIAYAGVAVTIICAILVLQDAGARRSARLRALPPAPSGGGPPPIAGLPAALQPAPGTPPPQAPEVGVVLAVLGLVILALPVVIFIGLLFTGGLRH